MKRYLKFFLIICPLLLSFQIQAQNAALLLEENFDFSAATDMAGKNGWTAGTAGTNRITVSDAGLTYPNYPSVAGKAASFTPLTDRLEKTFTGSQTGNYYYSFLINVSSAGSGEFFAGLYSLAAFRGRVYIKVDGTGFQFGLVKTTSGTVTYTSGTPYAFNTTYLVVVKYEFVSDVQNDKVSLYINPDLTQADPGNPIVGPLTDTGNDVSANVFAIQGRNNSGNFTLDGIRVATSWAGIRGDESAANYFLELPRCISSYMVIQRETPMKFWGWGTPGETVEVEFTRQSTTLDASAVIDAEGRWSIQMPAQTACSEACQLKFKLKNRSETSQELDNILIGDVWFAGGQSNMEKKVNHLLETDEYVNEADNYTNIRSFRATYNAQGEPVEKVNDSSAPWFICNSSKVADNVSAVAYVFVRDLYDQLQIPIGILQSYRGGTELETWVSPQKFAEPEYCKIAGRDDFLTPLTSSNSHSVNFNGQINPLINYPIKGFLWYQGESNTKRPNEYRYMMKMLVEDWRSLWGLGDLPFYYIQMFNVSAQAEYEEATWADLREQQAFLLYDKTVSNTAMAVIIDTNEEALNSDGNIRMHPRNKKPAGERMARIALRDTYGYDMLAEGPILNRYSISNDSVYLYFRDYGDGLKIRDGETELKGFVISGADKKFRAGTAVIYNDSTVVVKSAFIPAPKAVRYGWARNPICNLYNSIDIPTMPFRTDMWSLSTYTENQTSCTVKNSNADLVAIRINGVPIGSFTPNMLSYEVNVKSLDEYLDVTAIADNPFAKISIAENMDNKVKITVTAEDLSVKTYELTFSLATVSVKEKQLTEKIGISSDNNEVTVQNNSNEEYLLSIYNVLGQLAVKDVIASNNSQRYSLAKGTYVFQFMDSSGVVNQLKYLLK